jgi:hypothetical protein
MSEARLEAHRRGRRGGDRTRRNRLGRRGFGDSTGRACRNRMGRVAGRQGGPHGQWPRAFQRGSPWRLAKNSAARNAEGCRRGGTRGSHSRGTRARGGGAAGVMREFARGSALTLYPTESACVGVFGTSSRWMHARAISPPRSAHRPHPPARLRTATRHSLRSFVASGMFSECLSTRAPVALRAWASTCWGSASRPSDALRARHETREPWSTLRGSRPMSSPATIARETPRMCRNCHVRVSRCSRAAGTAGTPPRAICRARIQPRVSFASRSSGAAGTTVASSTARAGSRTSTDAAASMGR